MCTAAPRTVLGSPHLLVFTLPALLALAECDSEIRTTAPVPLDGPVGEKTSILSVLLAQAGTREQEQFLARVQAGYLAALHHRRLIRDLTPHGTALTADNVSQLGVLLFPFKNALISAHCQGDQTCGCVHCNVTVKHLCQCVAAYPSLYATAGTLPPQAEGMSSDVSLPRVDESCLYKLRL